MTDTKFIGYVGTYTKGKSEGIYSFLLDTKEKKIMDVKVAATIENPTYLTINQSKNLLFSVGKYGDHGGVFSFNVDSQGRLSKVNNQTSVGSPPCHVSVDKQNHTLLSANYHKGTIEVYPFQKNGEIMPLASVIQFEGTGPDPRQEKAHAHYASFSPDERFVVTTDLGSDKIITFSLENNKLEEKNVLSVKPGSGPRHLVFHPSQSIAYVMTEFSSEVLVLDFDSESGFFTIRQTLSTIPSYYHENNQGSAIHISKDGRFVYAGNRGHNSIAIFKVHEETFELTFIDRISTEGHWPRDFVLDPTENFLIASNQESSNLVLFAREEETGLLTLLQSDVIVPDPVCVKFL